MLCIFASKLWAMTSWCVRTGVFCEVWILLFSHYVNVPACLFTELCSLFTLECITSLSIYQPRLHHGARVFPPLHAWCVSGGAVAVHSQDERFILCALRSFVWVLSSAKARCAKPLRAKPDTAEMIIHNPSQDFHRECRWMSPTETLPDSSDFRCTWEVFLST